MLKRAGHTEATIKLRPPAAGLSPAGVLCEIVSDDKASMARLPELEQFAGPGTGCHSSRSRTSSGTDATPKSWSARSSEARIPTDVGEYKAYVYESVIDGEQHLALVLGDVAGPRERAGPSCTLSVSRATYSVRCAATAARSSASRSTSSSRRAAGSSCICRGQ